MAEFQIGDRAYKRKTDAEKAIQAVRDRIKISGIVSTDDDDFLRDLIALHQDAEHKIGTGILRFEVRKNFGNTYGFWLIRMDGSETDFSFLKCIYSTSAEAKVRSAMRYTILDQIQTARDLAFGSSLTVICEITGVTLTRETCHMDHTTPSFIELADAFVREYGGYTAILTFAKDGDIGRRFVDQKIADAWYEHHHHKAILRPVSKMANLSILRRNILRKCAT